MFKRAVILIALVSFMPLPARAADPKIQLTYATMSDGVKIALAVTFPRTYVEGEQYPALFTMSGYDNSVYAMGADSTYVMVQASMRGTGCSGGQYHLFGQRAAQDGYEIIENWIVKQGWSDGRAGIVGHSFWGLMGFLVATTNPPHVKAVGVSGLIDDFYRGIVYMGGIQNYGFPLAWGIGRYRPDPETAALEYRGQSELEAGDPTCVANIASRPPQYPFLPVGVVDQWDDDFWREHDLATYAHLIKMPIHIRQQYQDEQTGPWGYRLWSMIPETTPKRIVFSNGKHDSGTGIADRRAWLDCWILRDGGDCGDLTDPEHRVQVLLDTLGAAANDLAVNPPVQASTYPLPHTEWEAFAPSTGGVLSPSASGSGPADAFETHALADQKAGRNEHPSAVTYVHRFSETTAYAGPAALDLHATIEGADADVFVELADQSPDGRMEFLQRGMLRATHRAVDDARSLRISGGSFGGEIVTPFHPHTQVATQPVLPGGSVRMQIGIPAFGHVFRPDHALVLRISSPPETDRVGGTYKYASPLPPAVVSVQHEQGAATRLLMPKLPVVPPIAEARSCGELWGIPCLQPPDDNGAPPIEDGGCIALGTVAPSCSFVASGAHSYVGESVNELRIRVIRDGVVVAEVRKGGALGSPTGLVPINGTIPSRAGDTIQVDIVPGCAPGGACGTSGFLLVGNPAG